MLQPQSPNAAKSPFPIYPKFGEGKVTEYVLLGHYRNGLYFGGLFYMVFNKQHSYIGEFFPATSCSKFKTEYKNPLNSGKCSKYE